MRCMSRVSEHFIVDALRFTEKTSNTVPWPGELSILFLFGVSVLLSIIDASQTPIHLLVYHFGESIEDTPNLFRGKVLGWSPET